jgi:hypothetical protein
LSLFEISKRGWRALVKELGYADAIRFLLLYGKGEGDYLKIKKKIFGKKKAREIFKEIKDLGHKRS